MSGTLTAVAIGALPTGAPQLYSLLPVNVLPAGMTGGNNQIDQTSIANLLDSIFGTLEGTTIYRGSGGSGAGNWSGLAPGSAGQFLATGGPSAVPSWAFASANPSGQGQGYAFWYPGTYGPSQVLYEGQLFYSTAFAANMGGIAWTCDVAPASNTTLTLLNAGTSFGTVVFPASSVAGTVTSTAITLSANTSISCKAASTADLSLAGVQGRFFGTRP